MFFSIFISCVGPFDPGSSEARRLGQVRPDGEDPVGGSSDPARPLGTSSDPVLLDSGIASVTDTGGPASAGASCGELPDLGPYVLVSSGDVLQEIILYRYCVDPVSGDVSGWFSSSFGEMTGGVVCQISREVSSSRVVEDQPYVGSEDYGLGYGEGFSVSYGPEVVAGDCSPFAFGGSKDDDTWGILFSDPPEIQKFSAVHGWGSPWGPYDGAVASAELTDEGWDLRMDHPTNEVSFP